jgi:hypothetical protein
LAKVIVAFWVWVVKYNVTQVSALLMPEFCESVVCPKADAEKQQIRRKNGNIVRNMRSSPSQSG